MESKGALQQKPMEEAMEKLKIDVSTKASNVNLPGTKDAGSSDAISCISSGDVASTVKESEMNQEASTGDQGMYYYGYYYPGSFGGWDDNGCFVGTNGLEMHSTVAQADNMSYLCYIPGYENGYVSYNPYIPGAIVGVDGQYVGQEPYYSSAPSQDPSDPGIFAQPIVYGPELVPAYTWDPSFVLMDGVQGHSISAYQTNSSTRPKYSSNNRAVHSSKVSRSTKSVTGMKGSSSALDTLLPSASDSTSSKAVNKVSGASLTKGYLPASKFAVHTNQGKGGLYQNKGINLNENGRSWSGSEKIKTRSKLNGFGDNNLTNENNRTNNYKNSLSPRVDLIGSLSTVKVDDRIPSPATINKDAYNLPDFVTKYDQALFFVIKSYSEDDIHKSIKYNVWASTPNGNKRLDNAYRVAQEKTAEKGIKCPVFLFFSVNASGQFCGMAEMVGPIDFNRSMNFWQQDKWNGFFPVKWHIIKDVPNPQFRHIILENNENKPVTNSRDTQEVKFPQGTEMLNIFKNYSFKTSILDDFEFYENRQKVMQERRSKPLTTTSEHSSPEADKQPAEIRKQSQFVSAQSTLEPHTENENDKHNIEVGTEE